MSDISQGQGWWLASDGQWYPPSELPGSTSAPASGPAPTPDLTRAETFPTVPSAYQHGGYGTYGPVVEPASPRNGLPRWAVTVMAVVLLGGFGVIGYSLFVQNAVPSNQTATTTGTVNSCFLSSDSGFFNTATFRVGEETYSA